MIIIMRKVITYKESERSQIREPFVVHLKNNATKACFFRAFNVESSMFNYLRKVEHGNKLTVISYGQNDLLYF